MDLNGAEFCNFEGFVLLCLRQRLGDVSFSQKHQEVFVYQNNQKLVVLIKIPIKVI